MEALFKKYHWSVTAAVFLTLVIALAFGREYRTRHASSPIKVGILHSLTGTMAISERSLVDAVQMAVDHRVGDM